ncbi:MAG: VWA domain-containing protein, partial [Elusimicrobia bacterium]|nr:VWA domain-containing protein [Elusimicrobiota bacterium]
LEDHARRASEALRPQVKENPTNKDVRDARKKHNKGEEAMDRGAGEKTPAPLSIEEIADTQRRQIMGRQSTPYQNAYQPVAHLANPMVTHLENVFLKNSRPRDVGFFDEGKRPHMLRAMKREGEGGVRRDVMLRRVNATKRRYKVTLLVDESGSMDEFRREAIQTVVLLVDALSRLNIDVEVIGFSEKARIHKKFSEPLTPAIKDRLVAELQEYLGNGNTHDADALKLALERISKEDADERYVFVVSDGRGNGPSSVSSVLPTADKLGVKVMGVGVGEGMAYVREVYPRHAVVQKITELPKTLRDKLVESISRAESAARGAAQRFLPGSGTPAGSNLFGKALGPWFLPVWALGAAWTLGVMLVVAALAAIAPALGSPLAAIAVFGGGFALLKLTAPEMGGVGFVSLIAALLAGAGLPLAANAGLAVVLGAFFAAERGESIRTHLNRPRPIGGEDTALLAFFAALAWFPLFSYAAASVPLLAAPFVTAAVVVPLVALWKRTGAEEPILYAYLSAGAFVLGLIGGGWLAGAVIGTGLGFRGLYGAFKNRQLRAAEKAAALDAAAARHEEAAREGSELAKAAAAARAPVDGLRARAERVRDAQPEDLPGRLRRAAIEEALASHAEAPSPVNARRLEALLEDRATGGSNALGANVARWLALPALGAYVALQFALPALGLPGLVLAVLAHLGASGMWGWLAFKWNDKTTLPFMLLLLAVGGGASATGLLSWQAAVPWFASAFAVAGASTALMIDRQRRGRLPFGLQLRLRKAAPSGPLPGALEASGRGLRGGVQERWSALRKLRADAGLYAGSAEVERLFPMIELLADEDLYKELRSEAIGALAAYLPRPSAREALERVSRIKKHPGTAWEASTAVLNEMSARVMEAAAEQQRAEQARNAEATLESRAEAALGAIEGDGLASRLRRGALEEALAAHRAAPSAITVRRLEALLADDAASGSNSLGASLERWLWRPWPISAATGVAFQAAVTALVFAFPAIFQPLGPLFSWGFLILFFGQKAFPARALLLVPFFLSAAMAVAGLTMGPMTSAMLFPSGVVAVLYLVIAGMLAPKIRERFGLLASKIERDVRAAARGLTLDPVQAGWAADLALRQGRRLKALEAMRRDPARARALEPVLRQLWATGDTRTLGAIVAVVERWGDEKALETLDWMGGWIHTESGEPTAGARMAQPAAAAVRESLQEAAELDRLAAEAAASNARDRAGAGTELLAEARAMLEGLGDGLSDRLRKGALDEALAEVAGAKEPGEAAIAVRRLRERLDAIKSSGGAGSAAMGKTSIWSVPEGLRPSPGRFDKPLSQKLVLLVRWEAIPVGLMQSSWILGLAAAPFIGASAWLVFGGLLVPGLLWHLVQVFWPRKSAWHVGPTAELYAQAHAAWEKFSPERRADFETAFRGLSPRSNGQLDDLEPWRVRVDHPFLYLVHPYATPRLEAYRAAQPLLEAEAKAMAPLLAAGIEARELATSMTRPGEFRTVAQDYEVLSRLGPPGALRLLELAKRPVSRGPLQQIADAVRVADLSGVEADEQALPEVVREALREAREAASLAAVVTPQPASERAVPALAEARRRLSEPAAEDLMSRLSRGALEEAAAAVEAAPGDPVRVARLEEILRVSAARPAGSNAVGASSGAPRATAESGPGSRGAVRAWATAAVGSALSATLVSAAATLAALWAVLPAAAVALGLAAGALGFQRLTAAVPTSSRELSHAPRALSAVPHEFRPVALTLGRLVERLGSALPQAALYRAEDPAVEHGGWNAVALGPRLSEDATVGVGESWLHASPDELAGALAHELAHLYYGDNRRLEAFRRAATLAVWTLPFSVAAAVATGAWTLPAAAALLWAASLVSGSRMQRAHERRADRFAAWLAGPKAARAYLTRLFTEAPDADGGPLATHPAPARRLAELR